LTLGLFRRDRCPALKVKLEYLGHIKNLTGDKRQEEIEMRNDSSIADLLALLSRKYGEPFKKAVYESGATDVKSNFMVTVNGYLLNQLKGVQTKLKNEDHVILMPVVSGG
jgi:MoaD family protein